MNKRRFKLMKSYLLHELNKFVVIKIISKIHTMIRTISLVSLFLFSLFTLTAQQDSLYLWPDGVPLARDSGIRESYTFRGIARVQDVVNPMLMPFFPPKEKATGASVIICPGGGYRILAIDHEGFEFARWFNERGIAAFVLKYRLPNDEAMDQKEIAPLMDAQQAFRMVRENAKKWNLDPRKVGVMGFSAGGHLASTAGTHFMDIVGGINDTTSVRPDFMILGYPVVTFDPAHYHGGSRRALLGDHPTMEMVDRFSNEKRVTDQTPPTFLVHSTDDGAVPVENSIHFYLALRKHGIPAEMHIYEKGGHGYGMGKEKDDVDSWTDRLHAWLARMGMVGE